MIPCICPYLSIYKILMWPISIGCVNSGFYTGFLLNLNIINSIRNWCNTSPFHPPIGASHIIIFHISNYSHPHTTTHLKSNFTWEENEQKFTGKGLGSPLGVGSGQVWGKFFNLPDRVGFAKVEPVDHPLRWSDRTGRLIGFGGRVRSG